MAGEEGQALRRFAVAALTPQPPLPQGEGEQDEEEEDDFPSPCGRGARGEGFVLEYDAARKIAQGLGAHLEQLASVVEVKGDKARLLAVSERARLLFGKDEGRAPTKRAKTVKQKTLFDETGGEDGEDGDWGELNVPQTGATVLDRLHQGMILFAAGRGEALRRFLVEEGVGRQRCILPVPRRSAGWTACWDERKVWDSDSDIPLCSL